MSTLFFYTKEQFFNFKTTQTAAGFEFLSMSKLLSSQKIDGLDEYQQYYVDISSLVGFAKANDSQLLRKNSKGWSIHLEYLISWANIKFSRCF